MRVVLLAQRIDRRRSAPCRRPRSGSSASTRTPSRSASGRWRSARPASLERVLDCQAAPGQSARSRTCAPWPRRSGASLRTLSVSASARSHASLSSASFVLGLLQQRGADRARDRLGRVRRPACRRIGRDRNAGLDFAGNLTVMVGIFAHRCSSADTGDMGLFRSASTAIGQKRRESERNPGGSPIWTARDGSDANRLAVRAQRFGSRLAHLARGGVSRQIEPALEIAHRQVGQRGDPPGSLVQAGNAVQLLAAGAEKGSLRVVARSPRAFPGSR